jgi:uncharacterized Zn-binding protein involved in type VI secretion
MPPAARSGDKTSHGGTIGPPPPALAARVAIVLIEGKPAAVAGSLHVCVVPKDVPLNPVNFVKPKPGFVFIGGAIAACMRDNTVCDAMIITGAMTVLIGGI